MIEHYLSSHPVHELIESLRGKTFEKSVRIPLAADTIDNLASIRIGIHHIIHRVDVILSVTINGNRDITYILRFHQPGKHCILMSPVTALADSLIMLILLRQFADNLPCSILATIIHKKNAAVITDFLCIHQFPDLVQKHPAGYRQNFFFVITGNDDIKYR